MPWSRLARRSRCWRWRRPGVRRRPPRCFRPDGDLVDEASGFVARPGRLTVVVSSVPESSAALADRLGRWFTVEGEPPPLLESTDRRLGASRPGGTPGTA